MALLSQNNSVDETFYPSQLDLICFSHLRWHFVTQRPQHLLTRCAASRRVFYWEEPWWDADDNGNGTPTLELMHELPNLWVLRPHLPRAGNADRMQHDLMHKFLSDFRVKRFIRWYYTPLALSFTCDLTPKATVYDCMDELSGFLGASPALHDSEQELFTQADVVFTGGMSLYEAKRAQHENVHAFPSSIDVDHFAKARKTVPDPHDQETIPHPRAGFFGVLDERFDAVLVAAVAALRPAIQFIFIGPTVKIDAATLPHAANIHYLGPKNYADLPSYLSNWDAALLPFALNASTRFISPTKTPEYLAARKPVISTPIHDVISDYGDAGLVAIASSPVEFADALDRALMPQPLWWHDAVEKKLLASSWDRTWNSMWQEVERVCEPPRTEVHHNLAPQIVAFRSPVDMLQTARHSLGRPVRLQSYDYLVVGAGLAGGVLAERVANGLGKRVLIIDKRDHVGGNTFDFYNEAGILVHKYGPHIFHTNSLEVVQYLSRFTDWRDYEHRVLAQVDGKLVPIPINLTTIEKLYGLSLDAAGMQAFLAERAETGRLIRTSEDIVLSRVGRELYEKFFKNYTTKQWGLDPSKLDASVAGRIPVRYDRDGRYFTDTFQAMPRHGFTRMFERMLDSDRITIRTSVEYADVSRAYPGIKTIYTGPVDEYFNFRFGPLPYRSLEFRHQTYEQEVFQPAAVVNYPNDHEYTRITEFKYLTGQKSAKTSVVYEYPRAEGDPYYPIPRSENAALYGRYKDLADRKLDVHFVGRLATYKYYNMDQVVAQALMTYRKLSRSGEDAALTTSPENVIEVASV